MHLSECNRCHRFLLLDISNHARTLSGTRAQAFFQYILAVYGIYMYCCMYCIVKFRELDTLILLYTHQKLTQDQLIANLAMKEVTDAFTTENQYYYW